MKRHVLKMGALRDRHGLNHGNMYVEIVEHEGHFCLVNKDSTPGPRIGEIGADFDVLRHNAMVAVGERIVAQ